MLSKKILLSSALISMAGLVACGDDSSSNSGSDSKDIPEKVETIEKALRLNCNEEIKCTMVYVEEVKDNFFCNGTNFEPYSPILNAKDCPAEEEKKTEGDEKKAPESSASNSGDKTADSSDSTDDNGGNDGDSSSSTEEVTGPTGDVVSCLQEISMMGITTQSCSEIAASSEDVAAMQKSCRSEEGFITATLGTGCPATYTKKCVIDNENVAYFYEAANANQDCANLIQKK